MDAEQNLVRVADGQRRLHERVQLAGLLEQRRVGRVLGGRERLRPHAGRLGIDDGLVTGEVRMCSEAYALACAAVRANVAGVALMRASKLVENGTSSESFVGIAIGCSSIESLTAKPRWIRPPTRRVAKCIGETVTRLESRNKVEERLAPRRATPAPDTGRRQQRASDKSPSAAQSTKRQIKPRTA